MARKLLVDDELHLLEASTSTCSRPARAIAKWDGTAWSEVGGGLDATTVAMAVHGDGNGPALFAGGNFNSAGGVSTSELARWNGSTWSDVGGGTNLDIEALAVFDDGLGEALFAARPFTTAGSTAASGIAKWNGLSWAPVGSGLRVTTCCNGAKSLVVYDDGDGATLYVGGIFSVAFDSGDSFLAKWGCAR